MQGPPARPRGVIGGDAATVSGETWASGSVQARRSVCALELSAGVGQGGPLAQGWPEGPEDPMGTGDLVWAPPSAPLPAWDPQAVWLLQGGWGH